MFLLKYLTSTIFSRNINQNNKIKSKTKPHISSTSDIIDNFEKSTSDKINSEFNLLNFKEFRYLYNKTGVPPVYFAYILFILLVIMVVGLLENMLTFLVGLLYPIYYSIKALRRRDRERIRNWLKYWIIFAIFMNFEGVFAYFLNEIPLYFFYKVMFLLVCFLPHYNGAQYFYENFIKSMFNKYEHDVYDISVTLAKKLRTTLLEEESENVGEEQSETYEEDSDEDSDEDDDIYDELDE